MFSAWRRALEAGMRPVVEIKKRSLMLSRPSPPYRCGRSPAGAAFGDRSSRWKLSEPRRLLSTYFVVNAADAGPGSLRAAITSVNADPIPGTDDIVFGIPASIAPLLNVPFPGFDPGTQTWTIALNSPLPALTHSVSIDGYTQAHFPVPYLYPDSISSAVQTLSLLGSPTGGTFTLTTSSPLPVGTTAALPLPAVDAGTVQDALAAIVGAGNVLVTGGPLPSGSLNIAFQGADAQQPIPVLTATNSLTGGTSPSIGISPRPPRGGVAGPPSLIASVPNTAARSPATMPRSA